MSRRVLCCLAATDLMNFVTHVYIPVRERGNPPPIFLSTSNPAQGYGKVGVAFTGSGCGLVISYILL